MTNSRVLFWFYISSLSQSLMVLPRLRETIHLQTNANFCISRLLQEHHSLLCVMYTSGLNLAEVLLGGKVVQDKLQV